MLIEVKVKVARVIDSKTRKRTETFIMDREFFSEAEYIVTAHLTSEQQQGVVEGFEIQLLKQSSIREIADQFVGDNTFIATLKDIWTADDGTEKYLKYNVLLWADNPTQALSNTLQLAHEGYDMQVEGIKQADYEYITVVPETTVSQERSNE